jgi:hypothetical protein
MIPRVLSLFVVLSLLAACGGAGDGGAQAPATRPTGSWEDVLGQARGQT